MSVTWCEFYQLLKQGHCCQRHKSTDLADCACLRHFHCLAGACRYGRAYLERSPDIEFSNTLPSPGCLLGELGEVGVVDR